jgi:hypothetical protein
MLTRQSVLIASATHLQLPTMHMQAWQDMAGPDPAVYKALTISSKPPPGADKRDTSPTIGSAPWIFFATRLILPKKSLMKQTNA